MTTKTHLFWSVACALALLAAAPAVAQDVDAGQWIDLFDGETLYGWTVCGDGEWAVVDNNITCSRGYSGYIASTSRFQNFQLSAQIRVGGKGTAGLAVRAAMDKHTSCPNGGAALVLEPSDDWYTVVVDAVGDTVTFTVNGEKREPQEVAAPLGHIMVQYQRYHRDSRGPKLEVKSMRLRPIGMKPLFDGKSLDGWNIIPDRKSKFTVVDGAINITDGNGQIETDGEYRDFIFQIDVISNGEHLNSGVFFRGPKGVFWKGYEAQVRNQWVGDNREKPVDFGTGGLYGVDPAREVVSSDHEWFTKTIVADNNHFAVWVNGKQVSDFYDTRPVSPNGDGKNGFVPKPGTIHLQGHDPTTDLSFKNINIQEYTK